MKEPLNTAVKTSLSTESARAVRFERFVNEKPNMVSKATARGYYDYLLGFTKPEWVTFELQSHYNKGMNNGKKFRDILNSRCMNWSETVIKKDGSRWYWEILTEGYYIANGFESSERLANYAAEVARSDATATNYRRIATCV